MVWGWGVKRALSLREFQIKMLGEYPYCSRSVENHVDFFALDRGKSRGFSMNVNRIEIFFVRYRSLSLCRLEWTIF